MAGFDRFPTKIAVLACCCVAAGCAGDGNGSGFAVSAGSQPIALFGGLTGASNAGLTEAELLAASQIGLDTTPASRDIEFAHPAAQRIDLLGKRAMAVMADPDVDTDGREAFFRELMAENLDARTIGRFVIGKHWRRASPDQRDAYMAAFERFIVNISARQLSLTTFDRFEVIDAKPGGKKTILVKSRTLRQGKPFGIVWKLRPRGDRFLVVDLAVEGVSMAMARRQEFNSIIQSSGGQIDSLISRLESFRG